MAQITIYVPDEVARQLRRRAKEAKQSLSAYLTGLAAGDRPGSAWPEGFFDLQGSCKGTLKAPDDPPPNEREGL